jgi:hypothetical protein
MNVRASLHDFDRIRSTIGAALRVEHDTPVEPAPQSLIDLLRQLEIHVRDVQYEKVFADVDAAVAVLVRAAGREPKLATKPDPSRPGR